MKERFGALRFIGIAVVVVLGLGGSVRPASAAHLACGQTVSGTIVLDADLGPCTGDGLVVGANKTTIDLNGHTITGTGGSNADGDRDTGISIEDKSRVTITSSQPGGAIVDFFFGIEMINVKRSKILGGAGLTLDDNTDDTIRMHGSSKNRISGGVVVSNSDTADGIEARAASNKNRFLGITVTGNAGDGIEIEDSSKNAIKGSTVDSNGGEGVILKGVSVKTKIVENTVTASGDDGVELEDNSKKSKVLRNVVQGNVDDGINVDATGGNNLIKGNTTGVHPQSGGIGNGNDGIDLQGGTGTGNKIIANVANGNAVDGIHVENATTIVSNNVANDNGDNGIDAVAGTKGSGNAASGNANADCTLASLGC